MSTTLNPYEYLIKQLGLLVGFLDVSEFAVYNQIKNHDQYNLGMTIEQLYDNSYSNYQNHICCSAILLGFSHLEDFVTKCIERFLVANPEKNEFKVTFSIIRQRGNKLIDHIAQEKSKQMLFSEKIKFLEKHFTWEDSGLLNDLKMISEIRNCLMHNNGFADNRLAPKYSHGERIILSSFEANSFGLKAREFARSLWEQISMPV